MMTIRDLTFTARALGAPSNARPGEWVQQDYELGNQGLEDSRAAFDDLSFSPHSTLSRVWATVDDSEHVGGVMPDGRRAFHVNAVIRVETRVDAGVDFEIGDIVPHAQAPSLFGKMCDRMLGSQDSVVSEWELRGVVEATHAGPTPTLRI